MIGNFYIGYRENLPGTGTTGRPPTYDLFVPAGVPGDYNNNGKVDAADYVLWRNGGPLQNEVTTPGTVDRRRTTRNGERGSAIWRARVQGSAAPCRSRARSLLLAMRFGGVASLDEALSAARSASDHLSTNCK